MFKTYFIYRYTDLSLCGLSGFFTFLGQFDLDRSWLWMVIKSQLIKRPRRVCTVFINYHHKSGMHKNFFKCGKKLFGRHDLKNDLKWVANICDLIWVDVNSNFRFLKRIELIQLSVGNDLIWFNSFFLWVRPISAIGPLNINSTIPYSWYN